MNAGFPEGPIWLLGCGNMAGAMLRRWLATGLDSAKVTVITRSGRDVAPGVRSMTAPPPGEVPAILLLGVKPQQLREVAPVVAAIRPGVVVSILAGVEVATLNGLFPDVAVIRAMPNLPVAIGQGVVALYADAPHTPQARQVAELMEPLGLVAWIDDEARFDAVTALAGCGPAFVFRFAEALAHAGEALDLPGDLAARLALATVEGAAMMASAADVSPAVLADRVASPGGSTREGLNVLDRDEALHRLLEATLAAAATRNREMAAASRH